MRTATKLVFSFLPAGTSAPTGLNGIGVASVVRTSTGLFTVTLNDYWNKITAPKIHLALATPAAKIAQLVGGANVSSGTAGVGPTIQIETINSDTGAAVDVAAAAGNIVGATLYMSNSSFGAGL
jgi:hypothetical protein